MSETVKIIVTLSKGQYENLKDIQFGSIGSRMIFNAVQNGTPLPTGHGRLIDASAIESEMDEQFAYITSPLLDYVQVGQFYQLLYGAPTIIEADEVRKIEMQEEK